MRKLTFTVFPSARTNKGTPQSASWEDWCELFAKHEVRGKKSDTSDKGRLDSAKDGLSFVAGEIPEGKTRKSAHVRCVDALTLDLEKMDDDELSSVLAILQPFRYAAWTTHKSGAEVVDGEKRLRVVLPLKNTVEPSEHLQAWEGLNALIGGYNDPSTSDIARLNYFPSTFDPAQTDAWTNDGRSLALEDLPDETERVNRPETSADVRHKAEKIRMAIRSKSGPFKLLAAGKPFAEPGSRHPTMLTLTLSIADKYPDLSDEVLEELFSPSLEKMNDASPHDPMLFTEVLTAYQGAVSRVEQDREEEKDKLLVQQAGTDAPYTSDDLARIAAKQGISVEQLDRRWVLQKDTAYWLLTADGVYKGPFNSQAAGNALPMYIGRAPVQLIEASKTGIKHRAFADIVREHGTVAQRLIASLTDQETRFDSVTSTIVEAVCPVRELVPRYDEQIDEWLRQLGGPLYPKLIDWLACAPDLDKLLCALYFDGAAGAGKTLLAFGLASLWSGAPCDIKNAMGTFTSDIARCPVILADEEIPKLPHIEFTAWLRTSISTTSRTLSRKYLPESQLEGAIRVIIAANNDAVMSLREVNSKQDMVAIAQRLLHIKVSDNATRFIEGIPPETKHEWMREGIAAHALWLMQNHPVQERGRRFWVEGEASSMHRMLMVGTRWNSLICEFLARYLMDPGFMDRTKPGFIIRKNGKLYVNAQGIVEGWEQYVSQKKLDPDTGKIAAALRSMAHSMNSKALRANGKQMRYWDVDIDHILTWSDRRGIGSREHILAVMNNEAEAETA